MEKENRFKVWMAQIRANFLILAVLLVAIGVAFSYKYQPDNAQFNVLHAILLMFGVVFAHISVNLFNEYSDFKTRIDFNTDRNPFSGGSGMLTGGFTKPKNVLFAAFMTLIFALAIGIYFTIVSHWLLIILIAFGTFAVVFYTNFLAKLLLGELLAGLALGTLVVLGTYIAMTASPQSTINDLLPLNVILVSIPPGILTALLLFLNEFPDAKADKEGGRFHLVIKLGKERSSYLYTFFLFVTFGIIVLLPLINLASFWIYIALLPIPIAVKTSITAIKHGDENKVIIPALGQNVMIVLATDLLLAISILL